jgi:hypothetical protein
MRELLLEGVILSAIGGAAGLLAAVWIAPVLQSMLTSGLGTSGISVALDWPLIGATAALACTTGVLAGLLPALRFSSHQDALLKQRTAAGAPRCADRPRVLALQIAVSLPLVVGAALPGALHNLAAVTSTSAARPHAFQRRSDAERQDAGGNGPDPAVAPRATRSDPCVTSATLLENASDRRPESDSTVMIDGREEHMYLNSVGPHYLETMGIRLLGAERCSRATSPASRTPS